MPTAPVDDNGVVLYYEDSGAPTGSIDYTTLVLVHGHCFHGGTCVSAHGLLRGRINLRLVLLNMRGYPGSTPYSIEELEALEGDAGAQEAALNTRAAEIAAFLRWFIETEAIPPIREVPGSEALLDGLSLLSWSGGNSTTLAMLAHADQLSEATRELFNKYLRSFILYDPSSMAAGNSPPLGIRNIHVDRSVPLEDQAYQFGIQVGSFYPPYTLPDSLPGAETLIGSPRVPLQDTAAPTNTPLDPQYTPSVSEPKMSVEQFRSMTHPPILSRAHNALFWFLQDVFAANVVRALYDCQLETHDGSGMRKPVWPALKVHVVWCDMTIGEAAWAVAVLKCGYADAKPTRRRPMEFHQLKGANHLVHWEKPEKFVKVLAGII
ncbi:hypothetical protein C8Q80DRAFT_1217006 [Daedaleopsis nitida]|nr:hypothetical protein C8Q80DRAFT_1217006 [Daedaleopsis nitida]